MEPPPQVTTTSSDTPEEKKTVRATYLLPGTPLHLCKALAI